jgi:threonine dehydrogenase-like Zn-dependent dehydrogenase
MQAIQLSATIPRYLVGRLGDLAQRVYWSGYSVVYAGEVPEPELPTGEWVKIDTRLGGICGTDWNLVRVKPLWYLEPYSSQPFVLGHEIVGDIREVGSDVDGWYPGERVVVEPLLWCRPRGFDELCRSCDSGRINLCERMTDGSVSPGQMIGICRDTGGGWSSSLVAHATQLYRVPDSVTDENAVLVEPFAVGLHAALNHLPAPSDRVLIIGAGTIGLMTLQALRALGCAAEIFVIARHGYQGEAARRLGASDVFPTRGDFYDGIAGRIGARLFKPTMGKRVVQGGCDQTFECVGTSSATDDAIRLTRAGGTVVMVSAPVMPKTVDWTGLQVKELVVEGSMYYDRAVDHEGRTGSTFDLALHLMATGRVDLGWMVTHRFPLARYAQAFETLARRDRHRVHKATFSFSA